MRWRERQFRDRGFTLLELVLVLALIALAITMIAPSFSNFAKGRTALNTAGQFVAATRYARSQAIANGSMYRMNIDPDGRKWWLTYDNGKSFVQVSNEFGSEFIVPEGVIMTTDAPIVDGNAVIEFTPTGKSDPANVHFTGQKGAMADVICETPIDLYHVVKDQGGR